MARLLVILATLHLATSAYYNPFSGSSGLIYPPIPGILQTMDLEPLESSTPQSNWTVPGGCAVLSMQLTLTAAIEGSADKFTVKVDPSASGVSVFGTCHDNATEMVGLAWKEPYSMNKNMTVERNITFSFTKDNKTGSYGLSQIEGMAETYVKDEETNKTMAMFLMFSGLYHPPLFSVKIENSFSCKNVDAIKLNGTWSNSTATTTTGTTKQTTTTATKTTATTSANTTANTTTVTTTVTTTTATTTTVTTTVTSTTPSTTVTTTVTTTAPTTTVTTTVTTTAATAAPTTTTAAPTSAPSTTANAEGTVHRGVRAIREVFSDGNTTTAKANTTVTTTMKANTTTAVSTTTRKPTTTAAPNPHVEVSIQLQDVKIDAFRKNGTSPAEYQAPVDCSADKPNDIIPIVIGCVLAGLVVVVLVAYLVGRRIAKAREYSSME